MSICAALVYLVYYKQFDAFDDGIREITGFNDTADIFFTVPGKDISHWNTFIDQVVSTGLLLIFIMALTQDFNHMISEVVKPFAFSLIITGIAYDFGSRLFGLFIYGYNDVLRANNYFFWMPILGPIVGSVIAVWIYKGYIWIIKRYYHLSNIKNINTQKEIHPEVI
ncbi:unnamed protein product [Rotaria sordida]|uniref:Uncharacterized protein n=2 Tax=Rotaria sordida TaxID=392033 RepID=A0A819NAS8_9BILA|nr:unnamed protein product [Rotaria sordida]CAF3992011.1 unnamed protein product [Rotaria sordida]